MNKQDRRILIWNKYGKKCAYCGNPIEFKNMQVDHRFPKTLTNWVNSAKVNISLADVYNDIPENINHIDNLMPSCKRCNHYKRGYRLDEFRTIMLSLHKRIQHNYITKVGIDYGIVTIKPFDGMFYFEKLNQ